MVEVLYSVPTTTHRTAFATDAQFQNGRQSLDTCAAHAINTATFSYGDTYEILIPMMKPYYIFHYM